MYFNINTTMYNKLTALLLTILISYRAFAARNNGTITGKVSEKGNGSPLPYATISIHNSENKVIGGATSDNDGKFIIDKVIFGNCNVKVSFI